MHRSLLSVPFLYCIAALPLAFAFASSNGPLHWTRASAVSILGAEMFIVGSSAILAMCAAYASFAATKNDQVFARLMRFGLSLFRWLLFLILVGAFLMMGQG